MSRLTVNTNNDSPRGWQYTLLHSPKSSILFRWKFGFAMLFFMAGIFLGRAWSKFAPHNVSDDAKSPKAQHIATADTPNTFLHTGKRNSSPIPVAWLMSFPNSGTSYTSYLVRVVTGKNTATNYGTENVGSDGLSVPVFDNSPGGPFWSDPIRNKYAKPESGYLLTKTHCGSRCDQCPPAKYIENHQIFSRQCFEGYHMIKNADGEATTVLDSYRKDIVERAVHLIRDPFDNIVSRFHLAHKHFVKKNHTDKLAMYPRSKDGLRSFCKDLGDRFYKEEEASKFYRDVFDDVKNVPCHADFFRYIQWHNLAFTTTWDLDIPTHVIHYENYTNNFNQTKDMLLEFLEQDEVHEPPLFVTGKTYREYFTGEEVKAVRFMLSKLALDQTWEQIEHYFVE